MALTSDCLSCAECMTSEEYCSQHPETDGCESAKNDSNVNSPSEVKKGGEGENSSIIKFLPILLLILSILTFL